MSKKAKRWVVPTEAGDVFVASHLGSVGVQLPKRTGALTLSPLHACQLGIALQEASAHAGAFRAQREEQERELAAKAKEPSIQ